MTRLMAPGPTIRAFLLALVALCAGPANASDRNEGAIWLVNQVTVPLDERFSFHAMLQNRWVNDVESYERTVVRSWLGFDWTDEVNLAIGYDRHSFRDGTDENRPWQRITYAHDFGRPTLFTHFWLEQRFFEGTAKIAWRGRFQVGGSLELPHGFGLLLRNEIFVDLNETSRIRQRGLGENHLYAGVHYAIARGLRFDLGYLMQYRDQNDAPDLFDHTLFAGFSVRTPTLFGSD